MIFPIGEAYVQGFLLLNFGGEYIFNIPKNKGFGYVLSIHVGSSFVTIQTWKKNWGVFAGTKTHAH